MCYPGAQGIAAKIGQARDDMSVQGVDLGNLAGIGNRPLAIPQRRLFPQITGVNVSGVTDNTRMMR